MCLERKRRRLKAKGFLRAGSKKKERIFKGLMKDFKENLGGKKVTWKKATTECLSQK